MNARMMNPWLALVMVLAFSRIGVASNGSPFRSEAEFEQWTQNYYTSPSPDRLVAAVTYYSDSSFFERTNSRMPMAQFFASAFGDDSPRLNALVASLDGKASSNSRMFALHVLWLVNSDASRTLMKHASEFWHEKDVQRVLARMNDERPRDLLRSAVKSPTDLDMLWSMFFATGDRRPIERIVVVLPLVKDGHGLDIVLGGAAQWSLRANAREHPKVLTILRDLSLSATGTTKELLEEIVSALSENPGT